MDINELSESQQGYLEVILELEALALEVELSLLTI